MKRPTSLKGKEKKSKMEGILDFRRKQKGDAKISPSKIVQYGKIVYEVFWDSGAPGAGADWECIYKWRDRYAVGLSFDEPLGPFDTLSEAIRASELNMVTSATVHISSSELTAEQIARILKPNVDPPFTLRINDKIWRLSQGGKFIKHDANIES